MLALLLLGACTAENTPQPEIEAPGEKTQAPMGRDLHWMRNSAEYKAIVLQTYRLAALQLQVLVADKKPGTWAVATDADETVVDTSNFTRQWDSVGRQSPSAEELWQASAARQADPPLPGAVQFLQRVHSLGGRIAVVTNRSNANCPGLEANFLAFDIPFDIMLCKGDDPRKEILELVKVILRPLVKRMFVTLGTLNPESHERIGEANGTCFDIVLKVATRPVVGHRRQIRI